MGKLAYPRIEGVPSSRPGWQIVQLCGHCWRVVGDQRGVTPTRCPYKKASGGHPACGKRLFQRETGQDVGLWYVDTVTAQYHPAEHGAVWWNPFTWSRSQTGHWELREPGRTGGHEVRGLDQSIVDNLP